jgi:endogenous inhibitor of DNA gyrase (YacG/DUF329 family)
MSTGNCAVCGQGFASEHYQIPRRRYCSERCRKAAWRRRHPGRRRPRPDAVAPTVARPDAVPRTVPCPDDDFDALDVVDTVTARAEPAARCPHCARPVAVITLLVAPAAAQVPIPEARHD